MSLPVEVHPEAIEEARAARLWYAERSESVAERFVAEYDRALDRIADTPESWPIYSSPYRYYQLRRFPYLVIYKSGETSIEIMAVAHARRRPGYWKGRVRGES